MTPELVAAISTAAVAVLTALTTLIVTLRNGKVAAQTHAMVKADASPEALLAAAPPVTPSK